MKQVLAELGVVAILTAILASCMAPFNLGGKDLRNKTLTFYAVPMYDPFVSSFAAGHDTTTLVFDSTGKVGTYEVRHFTFDYPDAASAASGVYTQKVWFQFAGHKGTFSYDSTTLSMSTSVEEVYASVESATAIPTLTGFASADYSYQSVASYWLLDSATMAYTESMQVTQDGIVRVYAKGDTANTWVNRINEYTSYATGGAVVTNALTGTETYRIQSGSMVCDSVSTHSTDAGAGPIVSTLRATRTYSICKYFVVGQADSTSAAFSDVWKKGNTLTFQLDQTEYVDMCQVGDTALAAPTISPATGIGVTGTWGDYGNGWYRIDKTGGHPSTVTFANEGTYIATSSQFDSAARCYAGDTITGPRSVSRKANSV